MQQIGTHIFIKPLSPEDVTQNYANWMADEEVTQFLESRWNAYIIEDLKNYIKTINDSPNDFIFGIFIKETSQYIGNIKIGSINQLHRFGDIGLMLGEKTAWGKGFGTEAITLATKYAFEELNLNKLIAGIYANNIGSYKAFLKAGYREAGLLKNHRFYKGIYIDEILVEKSKTSY